MKAVGVYEAKTHFSELLRDVENGETVTVTRHGIAVARIVPIQDPIRDASAAIDELRRFQAEHQVRLGGDITLQELIEDGRR